MLCLGGEFDLLRSPFRLFNEPDALDSGLPLSTSECCLRGEKDGSGVRRRFKTPSGSAPGDEEAIFRRGGREVLSQLPAV